MLFDQRLKHLKKMFGDNLIKKIVKNSGIIFFGNSTASALSIISFAIMAKQLGPESLAILVLAQTYAMIINDIFNIQTWESMVKFGSGELQDGDIGNVIKTNFLLDFISAIVATVFALLLIKPVALMLGWDTSFLNAISLYSISILFNITTFTIGIPRLYNKFLSIAKIQVIVASLKLIAVLYAMFFSNTLMTFIRIYLLSDILGNLLIIAYSTLLLNRKLGRRWWKKGLKIDKDQIRFIWWTNLRTIVRIPVRRLDMLVISSIMSIKMVGIYKVYKEVAGLIGRVGEPVNQSIFPEFTKLIGKKDISQTLSVAKKTILLMGGVSAVITLLLVLLSKFLIGTFFGVEYLDQIYALYVLLILSGINFMLVPINSLFIAAGFAKFSFYIVIFTNIIYLFIAYYFGMTIGIYGVILAFAAQMFFNQGLKVLLMRKYSTGWGTVVR